MKKEKIDIISNLVKVHVEIYEIYEFLRVRESKFDNKGLSNSFKRLRVLIEEEGKLMQLLLDSEYEVCSCYFEIAPFTLFPRLKEAFRYYKHKKDIDNGNYTESSVKYITEGRQKEFYLRMLQNEIDDYNDFEKRTKLISEKWKEMFINMHLEDIIVNKNGFWSKEYSALSQSRENKKLKDKNLLSILENSFDEILRYSNLTFNDRSPELSILKRKFKSILLFFDKESLETFKKSYLEKTKINFIYFGMVLDFINISITENTKNKGTICNLRLVK